MKKTKRFLVAELPPFAVAVGLGLIFGNGSGVHKGALLAAVVFLIMQPFRQHPLLRQVDQRG